MFEEIDNQKIGTLEVDEVFFVSEPDAYAEHAILSASQTTLKN